MCCTSAANTILGVPYYWGLQTIVLASVLSHLLYKRKLPQLLILKLSWVWSLRGPAVALYAVLWMMWEHPDVLCLMLVVIIDARLLAVFFNHGYLLLLSLLFFICH